MLLEGLELPDRAEEIDQLADTTAEQLELAENLGLVEIELASLGHGLKALLCELVLLDVGLLEVLAALKHSNKLVMRVEVLLPEAMVIEVDGDLLVRVGEGAHAVGDFLTTLDLHEVDDVELAVRDHLVGDLHKESGHALSGVVVASDGVDHLDRVHKSRKGLLNGLWAGSVEGLEVFLERLEVLDVILGLRELLSDLVVDSTPVGGGHVDLLVVDTERLLHCVASVVEEVVDSTAVLAAELLTNLGELAHAPLPVVKLLDGTIVLVLTAAGDGVSDELVHLVLPLAEDASVVKDQGNVLGLALTEAVAEALIKRLKGNVALEGFVSLVELLGEPVEGLGELLLLIGFTHLPVLWVHLLEHRPVDVVDERLQGRNSVLRDFTEQHLLVTGALRVNRLAGLDVPQEEDALAEKLVIKTCKNDI